MEGGCVVNDDQDQVPAIDDIADRVAGDDVAATTPAGRPSTGRLAHALGVNRRTISKWRARYSDCPAGVDETEWRAFCARHLIRGLRAPLTAPALDVPHGTAAAPVAPNAAGAVPGAHAGAPAEGWSPAQRKAIADAELSERRRVKVQLEIDELQHRLVARDDLLTMVGALSTVYVHELVDLPAALVREMGEALPIDLRRTTRRACERAVEALRGRLETTLRSKLATVLAGPSPRGGADVG
jgi:hypothetical protein